MLALTHLFLLSQWRNRSAIGSVIGFFLISSTMSALILQPITTSPLVGYAIIWIILSFSILFSLDQLLQEDVQSGVIYDLYSSVYPLPLIICIKLFVHWMMIVLPILILMPIIAGLFFHLDLTRLMLSILIGSPILVMVGSIFYSLSLIRHVHLLAPIMTLPFYIPILIFGVSSIEQNSSLLLLGALLCISIAFSPIAIASIIKATLSDYL